MAMTKRKQQAMETKLRIQQEALKLFEKEGFEQVSMEQIAKAAGCSAGNIYNYFKSKEMLAVNLMDHVDAIYDTMEEECFDRSKGSAKERLIRFFGQALEISCKEPLLWQCFVHSLKYPEQQILAIKYERTFFRILKGLVEECQREGAVSQEKTAEEVVRQLTCIFRGVLVQWRIEEDDFEIQAMGMELAKGYLKGTK